MTEMAGKATRQKGTADAGPAQGVATEAARSPESGAGTAPEADVPFDTSKCADCGSTEVIYVTEDPAAEPRGYCATHLPANITPKMVEEQGRT